MDFDDDWAAVRGLPDDPFPGVPRFVIRPDTFVEGEATTPGGLIVPEGTDLTPRWVPPPGYRAEEPEFFGRFQPRRSEVTVLPADPPRAPIGWSMREMTQEEIAERDSPENLERLRQQREEPASEASSITGRRVWTTIPVLEHLNLRQWNAGSANFIHALRPSAVRVVGPHEGMTTDAVPWRVTVHLTVDGRIRLIEQEVEMGGHGFRNGQDARHFYQRQDIRLSDPQPSMVINARALARLNVHREAPLFEAEECEHGQGLTEYCEPCGRVNSA